MSNKIDPPTDEQLDQLGVLYRTNLHSAINKNLTKARADAGKKIYGPKVGPLRKQVSPQITDAQWDVYCGLVGGREAAEQSLKSRITQAEKTELEKTLLIAYKKARELIALADKSDLKSMVEFIAAMTKFQNQQPTGQMVQINNNPAKIDKLLSAKIPNLSDLDMDDDEIKQ
jgi:hypothetical protein